MKKEKDPGVESVEQGFVEEPVLTPAEEIEAESFVVSAAELNNDMRDAGFETPEKKDRVQGPSGVEQVEEGYQDQPAQNDVVTAAFGSGVVSPSELAGNLKAAGIDVPERPAKKTAEPAGLSGVEQVEEGFKDQPAQDVVAAAYGSGVVSPAELAEDLKAAGIEVPKKAAKKTTMHAGPSGVEQVEEGYEDQPAQDDAVLAAFSSGVASPLELASNLKAAGIEVPEKPVKDPATEGAAPVTTGVEQVETGFRTPSPLDVLAAASMSAGTSPKEWASNLRSVGVEVPERPVAEDDGATGIDSIQSGFTTDPEMNPVEELNAIKYAAAPQEVDEKVEQVQSERLGERVQVNDALLSKLKESGYTGDLEDLRKLFSDLKDN